MTRNQLLRKIGDPLPPEKMVTDDQTTGDIISQMQRKHKTCRPQYDKIADFFAGGSVYDVCQNLFNFCKENIAYREEPLERQETSSPQKILYSGVCDCKGYALFIGGVLDALNRKGYNIKWFYRYASDRKNSEIPGHVFIVVVDQGYEIWIDPVLDEFNQDHKFYYAEDIRIPAAKVAKVAGCGCPGKIGDDVKEVGNFLLKVSPELAPIPVIGWIAAAAGTVIGAAFSIFGDSWKTSNDVRWLTQKFQFYVLGNSGVTSNHNVDEKYTQQAQAWFSTVLGVPIYDQLRYHALRGTDPGNGKSQNLSREQRARNYLASAPDATANGVTYNQALAATYEADKFGENNIDGPFPAGSWKNFTAAKSLQKNIPPVGSSDMYVNSAGNLVQGSGTSLQPGFQLGSGVNIKPVLLIAAGAAILFVLLK